MRRKNKTVALSHSPWADLTSLTYLFQEQSFSSIVFYENVNLSTTLLIHYYLYLTYITYLTDSIFVLYTTKTLLNGSLHLLHRL